MRISDWSSDVCSSDLRERPHRLKYLAQKFRFPAALRANSAGSISRRRQAVSAKKDVQTRAWPGRCDEACRPLSCAHLPNRHPFLMFPICRSEEHTSELQSLMRISYALFSL